MSQIHNERILEVISETWIQHRRSPTYREIGAAVGISSSDHVARDLRRLKRDGYISFVPHMPRSIVVLKNWIPNFVIPPKPVRPPTIPTRRPPHQLEHRRGHCRTCGISSPRILCEACRNGEPLIQYHALLGEERFDCQNGSPWMSDGGTLRGKSESPERAEKRRQRYHKNKTRETRGHNARCPKS